MGRMRFGIYTVFGIKSSSWYFPLNQINYIHTSKPDD